MCVTAGMVRFREKKGVKKLLKQGGKEKEAGNYG